MRERKREILFSHKKKKSYLERKKEREFIQPQEKKNLTFISSSWLIEAQELKVLIQMTLETKAKAYNTDSFTILQKLRDSWKIFSFLNSTERRWKTRSLELLLYLLHVMHMWLWLIPWICSTVYLGKNFSLLHLKLTHPTWIKKNLDKNLTFVFLFFRFCYREVEN